MRRGKKQEIDTLISEEAMLLAKFLRNEKESWTPRIASLTQYLRHSSNRVRLSSPLPRKSRVG
jgi:hypothetical protein